MTGSDGIRNHLASRPLFGTFIKLARAETVDLITNAKFDFVVLDLEHGQSTYAETREALLAARANGIPALVRIGHFDPSYANRLLEAGAHGIQLSTVVSANAANSFARALRYQPTGDRSISLTQPAARYGATPINDYLSEYTTKPLAVGQLETVTYEDELDAILTPLDVAFIGPADLSVAAGTPGEITTGEAANVIERIVASAARTGTTLGTFVADAASARAVAASGYRYIVVGSDLSLLGRAAADVLNSIRDEAAA